MTMTEKVHRAKQQKFAKTSVYRGVKWGKSNTEEGTSGVSEDKSCLPSWVRR